MRFSSFFQRQPQPARHSERPEHGREEVLATAPSRPRPPVAQPQDLPDDLDQRVRMVGEWQLGEG